MGKKFEKKELDKALMKDYGVELISGLGKKITERVKTNGVYPALNEFPERLLGAVGDTSGLSPDETSILIWVPFKRLHIIGVPSII